MADARDPAIGRTLALAYTRAGEILSQNPQTDSEALSMDQSAREILQKLVDSAPDNVDLAHLLAFADWGITGVLIDMGDLEGAAQHENAALGILKKLSAADPRVAEYHADVALMLKSLAHIADDRGQPRQAVWLGRGGPAAKCRRARRWARPMDIFAMCGRRYRLNWAAPSPRWCDAQSGRSERLHDWEAAKDWYATKSLDTYQVLGAKYGESAAEAVRIGKKIQDCDRAVAALARSGSPSGAQRQPGMAARATY